MNTTTVLWTVALVAFPALIYALALLGVPNAVWIVEMVTP